MSRASDFIKSTNFIYLVATILGLAVFLFVLLYFKPAARLDQNMGIGESGFEGIAQDRNIVLMADTGLNIEWLINRQDGRRQIFERYRLVDQEIFEQLSGNEVFFESIDISPENARITLTYPDRTQEEIKSAGAYVLLSILPSVPAGEYRLNVDLQSGEKYEFRFEFKEPQAVELSNVGEIRKVTVEHGLTNDDEEEETVNLHAYRLGDLDLSRATSVFHITPGNAAYGGSLLEAREKVNIDKYFWIDIETLQVLLQGPHEGEPRTEHIFLAKVDGRWHYAIENFPFD